MEYAQEKARSRRILVICSPSRYPEGVEKNRDRASRLAQILSDIGFDASYGCFSRLDQLVSYIETNVPDLVFSAADHLRDGEGRSINLHGWLEKRGLPYVGSKPDTIDLALSKTSLKRKWLAAGVRTPAFADFDASGEIDPSAIEPLVPFPCIVKPEDGGNSRGISEDSVVLDSAALAAAVSRLARDCRRILIEHYLGFYADFREITCACVGNGEERLLMPAELVFTTPSAIRVITTADKEEGKVEARRIEDPRMNEAAKAFADIALQVAGARDYARCDMAFAKGRFWAIEVNGQPMVPDSWFASCARLSGLDELGYIGAIVDSAFRRQASVSSGGEGSCSG
ncbi:MAG TPA: hypothetical protein VIO60_04415 [Rectinemataceae bacterium]